VPISVNVSRVQLSNPNLAEEIRNTVDKYNIPHEYIDLELTESACFDDIEVLVHTMNSLRKMGFAVSMDDFGSGYSSLNLLKELPFDTLKIDGEFFRNVSDLNRANIVVKNIIGLAKSLDMKVVAEGIETEDQVNFLRTTECDLIQGYYYSKPISSEEFEKYMTKNAL
jgi:EAL domain-containing protein (putative c-di-GMP-specific phosphodiesterase class I)